MKIKIKFFQEKFIEAIGAGIYEIGIEKNGIYSSLYIGESVFVLVRCASHLYELKLNPAYFGFSIDTIDDPKITLHFKLIKEQSDKAARKAEEKTLIAERKPISQSGIGDRQKSIEDKEASLIQFLNSTEPRTDMENAAEQ